MIKFKKYFISPSDSILLAFNKISKAGNTLIVIDNKKNFLGTLSNGDLRKSVLLNKNIKSNISSIYNKKPYFIKKIPDNIQSLKNILLKNNYDIIPVVRDNKIIDLVFWNQVFTENKKIKKNKVDFKKFPVVVMAGGEGKRLEPFTHVLPKPLIPVLNKTVIEHILNSFKNFGTPLFNIILNYKSNIIEAFFNEMNQNYKINFIKEKKQLGTAGGLYLFKKSYNKKYNSLILTNCDIIFDFDISNLLENHTKSNNSITIVVSPKDFQIPYGDCIINRDGKLLKINEKPKLNLLVNTGMYVINKKLLDLLKFNQKIDMDKFIKICLEKKYKIGVYEIHNNYWRDIGQWDEYRKVVKELSH